MKKTYDRLAAGDRIRQKRNLLGFTQDEMAEKIDRAAKYYADIERGSCGMSVETLMALSETLDMSLDYIKSVTTSSTGGLILTLQRVIVAARPIGRCRKHYYWSATKRYFANPLSLILLPALLYTFALPLR